MRIPVYAARLFPAMLLLALLGVPAARATSVVPVSLERMSATAEMIFRGRVLDNAVRRDEVTGYVATYTRFELQEIIKQPGSLASGDTYTIKQIGGTLPDSGRRLVVHGVPTFTPGEEYVIFLPAATETGFTSPIGLGQGRFRISSENGVTAVSNGRRIDALHTPPPGSTGSLPAAADITRGLGGLPGKPAHAELGAFIATVRGLSR